MYYDDRPKGWVGSDKETSRGGGDEEKEVEEEEKKWSRRARACVPWIWV